MDVAFDLHRKPGLMDSQGVVNTAVAFFKLDSNINVLEADGEILTI